MERSVIKPAVRMFLRWRGAVTGPHTHKDICDMLNRGRITKHHEVSVDRVFWMPVSQMASYPCGFALGEVQPQEPEAGSAGMRHGGVTEPMARVLVRSTDRRQEATGEPDDRGEEAAWFGAGSSRSLTVAWLVCLGAGPLCITFLQAFCGVRFTQMACLYSLYFWALWMWILGSFSYRDGATWRRGFAFSAFTAVVGILMLLTWRALPIPAALYEATSSANPLARLAGFVLGVGILEELCKVAPLLLFSLKGKESASATDMMFLGMMSGLGFSVTEGVEYTVQYWSDAVSLSAATVQECVTQAADWYGTVNAEEFLQRLETSLPALLEQYSVLVGAQFVRFMALPLLHAAWAGIVAYSLAVTVQKGNWMIFFGGLSSAALLHGLYNFFVPTVYSLLIALCALLTAMALLVKVSPGERGKVCG